MIFHDQIFQKHPKMIVAIAIEPRVFEAWLVLISSSCIVSPMEIDLQAYGCGVGRSHCCCRCSGGIWDRWTWNLKHLVVSCKL